MAEIHVGDKVRITDSRSKLKGRVAEVAEIQSHPYGKEFGDVCRLRAVGFDGQDVWKRLEDVTKVAHVPEEDAEL